MPFYAALLCKQFLCIFSQIFLRISNIFIKNFKNKTKGTATAYLTGVKSRIGYIGIDGSAYDCKTSLKAKLDSILKWAYHAGKSTGIVKF